MKYKTMIISLIIISLFLIGCSAQRNIIIPSPAGNTIEKPVYANMWNRSLTGVEITLLGVGIYTNVTHLKAGIITGFNFSNGVLTILYPGVYDVNWHISFSGEAGSEYGILAAKNMNENISRACYAQRDTAGTDKGVASASCLVNLTTGDTISFLIEDEADPLKNPTIYTIGIVVQLDR